MYVKHFKRAARPERNRQQIQALDARVGISSRVERPSPHSARVAEQQTKRWLKLRSRRSGPKSAKVYTWRVAGTKASIPLFTFYRIPAVVPPRGIRDSS